MYLKSDNLEIMIRYEADKVKGSKFVFVMFIYYIINVKKQICMVVDDI